MYSDFIFKVNIKISTWINEFNEDFENKEIQNIFEVKRIIKKKKIENYETIDDYFEY